MNSYCAEKDHIETSRKDRETVSTYPCCSDLQYRGILLRGPSTDSPILGHIERKSTLKGIYIILEGNSFTNLRASVNCQGTAGTLGVDCSSKRALFEPPQDAPDLCLPHLQLPHQSGFRCSTPQGLLQAHTRSSSGQVQAIFTKLLLQDQER